MVYRLNHSNQCNECAILQCTSVGALSVRVDRSCRIPSFNLVLIEGNVAHRCVQLCALQSSTSLPSVILLLNRNRQYSLAIPQIVRLCNNRMHCDDIVNDRYLSFDGTLFRGNRRAQSWSVEQSAQGGLPPRDCQIPSEQIGIKSNIQILPQSLKAADD